MYICIIYVYICIHTYTYIHSYIHTYIQTDRQTDIHTYTCIHNTYIYIYRERERNIYIYIYMYRRPRSAKSTPPATRTPIRPQLSQRVDWTSSTTNICSVKQLKTQKTRKHKTLHSCRSDYLAKWDWSGFRKKAGWDKTRMLNCNLQYTHGVTNMYFMWHWSLVKGLLKSMGWFSLTNSEMPLPDPEARLEIMLALDGFARGQVSLMAFWGRFLSAFRWSYIGQEQGPSCSGAFFVPVFFKHNCV